MSFVMNGRWVRNSEAPTLPTNQIISIKCHYCVLCFPLWPSLFYPHYTQHGSRCFKDSLLRRGWGRYHWGRNKRGWRLLLRNVQFSYFYFRLLAFVAPRGMSLNLFSTWAWLASGLYRLKTFQQKQNSQTLHPNNIAPPRSNFTPKFQWPSGWGGIT